MSRRITTKAAVLSGGGTQEDYLGRVVKYIPAEIVTLYVSAIGIVPDTNLNRNTFLWGIFAFCAVGTPVFMSLVTRDANKKPLLTQVILATVAFPIWAYALGGIFTTTPGYAPFIGSLLLMAATFLFGLIEPK
jgi:hypothetical protein